VREDHESDSVQVENMFTALLSMRKLNFYCCNLQKDGQAKSNYEDQRRVLNKK